MPKHHPSFGQPLSPREREILLLRGEGLTARQVADTLFIEPRTVSFHCQSIYTKLGVHSLINALRALTAQSEEEETSGEGMTS